MPQHQNTWGVLDVPGFYVGSQPKSTTNLWDEGIADCEADSCGIVPDGTVVLVPSGKHPVKRSERIEELEGGVRLSGEEATFSWGLWNREV